MADQQPNPIGSFATGLGAGLQYGAQQKLLQAQQKNAMLEMQMKMAKEQYDKISHQSDQLGQQIMSGKVPDALLGPMYNQWASYQRVVNPGMAKMLPAVKDITPADAEIMKQMATVVMFGKQNSIDPKLIQSGLQDLYNKAMASQNVSGDFGKTVKDYMDTNFGTQPQTIANGDKMQTGSVNAFGQMTPISAPTPGAPAPQPGQAPASAPITSPNVPLEQLDLSKAKRVDELRQNFVTENKDFKTVSGAYQTVLSSAKNPSAAGDLSLIFAYMKTLDPGSVVREGEFATAQNAGGVDDKVRAMYNSIINGKRLSDSQRTDFVDRATKIYQGQEQRFSQSEKEYKSQAEKAGVDPSQVTIDLRAPGAPANIKAFDSFDAAVKANLAPGTQFTVGGKTYRVKGK